ncbi:hypothetical protein JHK87_046056 [Glycine soja]|nr:hypothetical protein JHK87_046056 [Glycine soja]
MSFVLRDSTDADQLGHYFKNQNVNDNNQINKWINFANAGCCKLHEAQVLDLEVYCFSSIN